MRVVSVSKFHQNVCDTFAAHLRARLSIPFWGCKSWLTSCGIPCIVVCENDTRFSYAKELLFRNGFRLQCRCYFFNHKRGELMPFALFMWGKYDSKK